MAKLFGAFKASLSFQPPTITLGSESKKPVVERSRKEKEAYCSNAEKTIVDIFGAKTEEEINRGADEIFSSLVTWCSDDEQDIRILADETLNKVLKVVQLNWPGRLLSLLMKQLSKSTLPPRSLKAIMHKIANVSHLVKPSKARFHAQNLVELLPALVDLNEDVVQEALGHMVCKLAPSLFYYASDAEIKALIRLLLRPLVRPSSAQQRAAASAIAAVCQSARKPIITSSWVVSGLLRMILPVDINEAETASIVTNVSSPICERQVGLMMAIKALLITFSSSRIGDLHEAAANELARMSGGQGVRHVLNSSNSSISSGPKPVISCEHLIIIFELCIHFCCYANLVGLVTVSLETLACLFQIRSKPFSSYLTTPNSLKCSWRIYPDEVHSVDDFLSELDEEAASNKAACESDDRVSVSDLPAADSNVLLSAMSSSASRLAFDRSDCQSNDSLTLLPVSGGSSLTSGVIVSESAFSRRPSSASSTGGSTGALVAGLTAELDEVERDVRRERMTTSKSAEEVFSLDNDQQSIHAGDQDEDTRSISTKRSGHSRTNTMTSAASLNIASPPGVGDSTYSNDATIGQLTDPGGVPLVFAVRMLSKRFLLSGYSGVLLSDRLSRISFKGLALTALSGMLSSHPSVVLNKLFPNEMVNQPLTDIFLYATHHDSHLKAALVSLVGNFTNAVLISTQKTPNLWTKEHGDALPIAHLVSVLEGILTSSSDQHLLKSTVSAVGIFLPLLLQSSEAHIGLSLLRNCMALKLKTYWLLKVELLDVLSKLDLMIICHLDSSFCDIFQNILSICINFLGDDDSRVRHAAAKALTALGIFGNLPIEQETVQDILLARARCLVLPVIGDVSIQQMNGSSSWLPCVFGLGAPFTLPLSVQQQQNASFVNSTALDMLMKKIYLETTSRFDANFLSGSISFFLQLSELHRPSLNLSSWSNISLPLLNLVLSLASSSIYAVDLVNHADLLRLATNLIACAVVKDLRKVDMPTYTKPREKWSHITGPTADQIRRIIEALFIHCLRMLNLFSLVFGTVASGNSTLLHLIRGPVRSITSSAQQAINRGRAAVESSSSTSSPGTTQSPGSASTASSTTSAVQAEFDRLFRGNSFGDCINQPHFSRIHKQLLKAFASYRLSSELSLANEKFGQLLSAVLQLLSTIFELSTLNEMRVPLEETVAYLRSALLFHPTYVIEAVYQLLKSLFGCSLVAHWDPTTMLGAPANQLPTAGNGDLQGSMRFGSCCDGDNRSSSSIHGFYHACFLTPYTVHTQLLASMSTNMTANSSQLFSSFNSSHLPEDGYSLLDDLRMCVRRRSALIFEQRAASGHPPSRADRELVESLIHPFEAIVIQSIRLYTLSSSDLDTQRAVLRLLTQLIYLRANYSLLDSNGAFMQCVIRQLEDLDHPSDLRRQLWLDDAFHFLSAVGLNPIGAKQPPLSFADLLTLTDSILANTLHLDKLIALPCLKRIVVDLFVCHSPRLSSSQQIANEVLAQMEFVVLKLCKLTNPRVYPCLIVVLQSSRVQGEDRWKRVSRQISDIVLPSLENRDTQFSCRVDFENFVLLLSNLTASVFRPVDFIFRVFYRQPVTNGTNVATTLSVSTNLATIVGLTCVLLVHTKEDMLLARIREFFKEPVEQDSPYASLANSSEPENAFISFQLDTIVDSVKFLVDKMSDLSAARLASLGAEFDFLAFLVSKSLLNILHIVHSGHFPRCIKSLKSYIESLRLDKLWSTFGISYPLPTLLWYQLVVLVTGGVGLPWNDLCASLAANSASWSSSFMLSTLLTLAADHLCERTDDVERLSWLLTCHSTTLLSLISEATLRDLIASCHRQYAASGLLVQAVVGALVKVSDSPSSSISPHLICRGLHALDQVHADRQLATLQLVIEKLLPSCRQWPQVKRRLADLIIHLSSELQQRKAELPQEIGPHWIQLVLNTLPPLISSRPVRSLKALFNVESSGSHNGSDNETTLMAMTPLQFFKQMSSLPVFVNTGSPILTVNLAEMVLCQHCSDWPVFISECSNPAILDQLLVSAVSHCQFSGFERMLADNNQMESDLTFEINSSTQSILFASHGGSDVNSNVYAKLVKSIAERCYALLKDAALDNFPVPASDVVCIDRFPEDLEESPMFTCPSTANRSRLLALVSYIESLHEAFADHLNMLVALSQPICKLLDICTTPHRHLIDEIAGFQDTIWLASYILVQYSRWHLTIVKCLPESDVLLACLRLVCYTLTTAQANTSENNNNNSSTCSWIANFQWTQLVSLLGLLMRTSSLQVPDPYSSHARLVVNACIDVFVHQDDQSTPCQVQFSGETTTLMRTLCFLLGRLSPLYDYALLPREVLTSLVSSSDNVVNEQQTHHHDAMSPYMLFEPDTLNDFLRRLAFIGWVSRLDFEEIWSRLLGVVNHYIADGDGERPREERIEAAHCCCLAVRGLTSLLCRTRRMAPKCPSQWVAAASTCHSKNGGKVRLYSQLTPLALLQSPPYRQYAVVRARLNEQFCSSSSKSAEVRSPAQLFCGFLDEIVLNSCDSETLIRNSGLEQYATDDSDTASESVTSSVLLPDINPLGEDIFVGAGLDVNSCIQFLLDLYTRWLVPFLRPTPNQMPPRALIFECISSLVLISDLFTAAAHWESMSSALFGIYGEVGSDDEQLLQILAIGLSKVAAVHQLPSTQSAQVTGLVAACLASKTLPMRVAGLHASIFLMQSRHQSLVKPIVERLFADRQILQVQQPVLRPVVNTVLNYAAAFYMLENFPTSIDANTQQFFIQSIQSFFQTAPVDESENPDIFVFVCRGVERLILTDCIQTPMVVSSLITAIQAHLASLLDTRRWMAAIGLLITCLYRLAASAPRTASVSSPTGIVNVQKEQQAADATRFANLERVATFAEKSRVSAIDPQRQLRPAQLTQFAQTVGDVMFDLIAPADLLSRVIGDLSTCSLPGPQLAFTASLVERVFSRLLACDQRQTLFDWALPSLTSLIQRQPLHMAVLTQIALLAPLTEKPFLHRGLVHYLPTVYAIPTIDQIPHLDLPISNCYVGGCSVPQLSVFQMLKLVVNDFNMQLNSGQRKLLLATYMSAASLDPAYNSLVTLIAATVDSPPPS